MSNNRITPFVKRMRTNGGTIYTFSSAVEDIGLNINERNNVVKISNFALLNIPSIQQDPPDGVVQNRFAITNIAGAFGYEQGNPSIKDGRVLIAESFENYALNLESNLLNREDYNPTLIRTVSERVFWKWLKESGAIRWSKDVSVGSKQYWSEEIDADGSLGYNSVVKYLGQVSAGNVRTDSFGTYNETYILVPTSHGQMDAYFEIVDDDNYYHGMEIGGLGEKILGRESYTLPHPDGLSYLAYYDFVDSSTQVVAPDGTWTLQFDNSTGVYSDGWWYTAAGIDPIAADNAYLIDSSSYQTTGIYNVDLKYTNGGSTVEFRRSKVDCLSLVFNLDELKDIYGDTELTYDKMAIQNSINDSFEFNAVLIYYTVWNSTQEEILGRNLLGVLFIDAPSGNSANIPLDGILLPALEKIQSGPSGFGTSYSLRLNIKTDNMVDDTGATIVDMATSDQLYAEDWTEAFANLNTAVNLLTQNNSVIQGISENYIEVQSTQTQILNDLQALQFQVNDIGRDITGTPNALALFADGDDPLVDSSVYMKFGNVGVKVQYPSYPLHVSGTTKLDEVIIQNAVRDTSNNIILGYGSPLQLGASTNYREVDIYTGNLLSALHIDTSNNILLRDDVSVLGHLSVDGSTKLSYLSVDTITSSSFDFAKNYIGDGSIGTQFQWINGYLEIIASSDVSAAGSTGNIQFNSGGTMEADASFNWKIATKSLGIRTSEPSTALHVAGDARIDSSLYLNGPILGNIAINHPAVISNEALYVYGLLHVGTGTLMTGDKPISVTMPGGQETSIELWQIGIANAKLGSKASDTNLYLTNDYAGGGIGDPAYSLSITTGGLFGIGYANATSKLSVNGAMDVSGNITLKSGAHRTIGIESSTTGTSYNLYLEAQNSNSLGGDIYVRGGAGSGGGGDATLTGGNSGVATGGNAYIKGGLGASYAGDGRVFIGTTDTSAIILGTTTNIPTGTAGANEVLYVDTADGNRIKRTSGGGGAVTSISNNVNNYVLTATGGSTINGEAGLSYNGTQLDVSGGLYVTHASTRTIGMLGITGSAGSLTITGAGSDTDGGDLVVRTGAGESSSGDLYIKTGSTAGTHGDIYLGGDNAGGSEYASNIFFYAGDASVERLTLDSSALQSAVPIKFPASDGYVIQFANDTDTGFYWNNTSRYLDLNDDGSTRFRFTIDTGKFEADNDIVGYSSVISDIRLKENIEELENPLKKILQVRGVSYDRKKTGERHLGVIAQEIEKIIPEVVVETTVPLETGEEDTLYKTVRYTEIIPYLIEAIKEQQKMIDELRREIDEINELKK